MNAQEGNSLVPQDLSLGFWTKAYTLAYKPRENILERRLREEIFRGLL